MPSKNNVSGLKAGSSKQILEPSKAGRRKKPVEDKESELIGLKLTVNEKTKLQAKAGRVPLATYLKDFLRQETDLLK
jgi:hypothetical protein